MSGHYHKELWCILIIARLSWHFKVVVLVCIIWEFLVHWFTLSAPVVAGLGLFGALYVQTLCYTLDQSSRTLKLNPQLEDFPRYPLGCFLPKKRSEMFTITSKVTCSEALCCSNSLCTTYSYSVQHAGFLVYDTEGISDWIWSSCLMVIDPGPWNLGYVH